MGGVSICMRERDDVIQIWNTQSDLAAEASVIDKVKTLLPNVHFLAEFYKGKSSPPVLRRCDNDAIRNNSERIDVMIILYCRIGFVRNTYCICYALF